MSSTIDILKQRALSALSEERQVLQAEKVALEKRRDLALRRLQAYTTSVQDGESSGWLDRPEKVTAMKQRLEAAMTDEKVLLQLVDEVRTMKDQMTMKLLALHSARCEDKFDAMEG